MSGRRPMGAVVTIGCMVALAGCAGSPAEEAGSSLPPPYDSERAGTVELATGESIGYRCMGKGEPAVVLEAGTDAAGTSAYPGEFVATLAEDTTVCVYDRPGTNASSSAPPDPGGRHPLGRPRGDPVTAYVCVDCGAARRGPADLCRHRGATRWWSEDARAVVTHNGPHQAAPAPDPEPTAADTAPPAPAKEA